jgi:hypothetical protein
MRKWVRTALLTLAVAAASAQAAAGAPQNGYGLAGGLVLHSAHVIFPSGTENYTSGGLSAAGDLQFVVNERWSLNPFLLLSLEQRATPAPATISNGAAGFQLRRWYGTLYLGAHAAYFVELLADATHTQTVYGPGLGFALGGESQDGLTWGAQVDWPRILTVHETRVGLRLHVGWRWR